MIMSTQTPWGKSQQSTIIERGVTFHSTAGHGGFLVTRKYAEKHLTKSAIKRGGNWGLNHLAYEEDCAAYIIFFEVPKSKNLLVSPLSETDLIKKLSRWYPDYLIELQYEPDPEEYRKHEMQKLEESMRRNKSPDLIVFATRDPFDSSITIVGTADDKRYRVTADSYKATNIWLPLLSECVIVSESHLNSIWESHFNEKF
jgi:hypothetical protein